MTALAVGPCSRGPPPAETPPVIKLGVRPRLLALTQAPLRAPAARGRPAVLEVQVDPEQAEDGQLDHHDERDNDHRETQRTPARLSTSRSASAARRIRAISSSTSRSTANSTAAANRHAATVLTGLGLLRPSP